MLVPTCTCCGNCVIFTDDFSTDRTGTDYTTASGTFSVAAGVITTTSAGALIVENTAGTSGHGRAVVTAKSSAFNGSFDIVGSYVDSSNYLFARVYLNGISSTLRLYKKVAGADTQLGHTHIFTASTGVNYTVEVCWNGTYASCAIPAGSGPPFISAAYTGTGNKAGLGASPNGGTVTFDDFTFSEHYDDEPTCTTCQSSDGSSCCCGIDMPATLNLNISGTGPCATCGTLDLTLNIVPAGTAQRTCGAVNAQYYYRVGDCAVTTSDIFCDMNSIEVGCYTNGLTNPGGIKFYSDSGCVGLGSCSWTIHSCSPFHATCQATFNAAVALIYCGGAGTDESIIDIEITE
jgi:hypothetical protein